VPLADHDVAELEPLLTTIMVEDFSVEAEDGSPLQVARSLLQWHASCLQGDFSMVERLRAVPGGAGRSAGVAVRWIALADKRVCLQAVASASYGVRFNRQTAIAILSKLTGTCVRLSASCIGRLHHGEQVDHDGTAVPMASGGESSSSEDDEDSDSAPQAGGCAGGDSAMEVEEAPQPPAGPVIDDDGFQLVQGRGGRRRR
jgi:hypothetical protein